MTFQTFDQSDEENLTIKSDTGQHSQFLKCRLILQRRRQCICMMIEILKTDIPTHWAGWVKSPKQARMSSDLLERHIGKTCLVTNPVFHFCIHSNKHIFKCFWVYAGSPRPPFKILMRMLLSNGFCRLLNVDRATI